MTVLGTDLTNHHGSGTVRDVENNNNMGDATNMTPPQLLREREPVAKRLAFELGLSRFQTYGLLDPIGYPVPAGLFDVRSDVAERVSVLIDWPVERTRDWYADVLAQRKAKAAVPAVSDQQEGSRR